ncbi:TlpA disulfide reductase family protein [Pedobacter sp. PLR]|uniref:TlpA family protein disulfide reductase n=1 Tax=Pedobacter sp. PLR TaxID=2994465 RepID=UPI0022478687|nr:TlpA disulfide reductase family protein [Pedobacter sp. PLR]MCX2453761.1 TlpA disulfide reductase family protein [Pedobacter sp. PLR]
MLKYATKLGKDSILVDQEIGAMRHANAEPTTNFSFQTYESGSKISLEDLKEKVILLTLWFPGCGPCRAEFPHLESVIKKFSTNQVAYIGINGMPEQDDFVIPFMRSTGYSFTAQFGQPPH